MIHSYERRKFVIITIFVIVGIVFAVKLFMIQVWKDEYKLSAENNVLRYVTQYPSRGLIFDRNGKLLVFNEAAYDLLVLPRQVVQFDTASLCGLLHISEAEFNERLQKASSYSLYKPSVFLEQISKEDYGYLEEQLYKFPGFYIQARTLRKYPIPMAAHLLGYIGEVNKVDIAQDSYYKQGDYIGKSGIERTYEKILRGDKGLKIKMVDVHNREMASFQNGKYDIAAISGKNINLTIDADLQKFGEQMMQKKIGSIVAIEPSSGEILAMVSSPSYDPNLLIGRIRNKNYSMLSQDDLKPLFNRATMAQYPPGSTFKTVNTLIGLQDGVLNVNTKYICHGTSSTPIPCSHTHTSPLGLLQALELSCNPYFWQVYKSILEQPRFSNIQQAYDHWRNMVMTFGIGQKLESDLPEQQNGNLPKDTYFNKYYGMNGWKALTVRSLSIGQGEIELTPLQMANLAATIANRGYYYGPHVLKSVEGDTSLDQRFKTKHVTVIDPKNYDILIEGLRLVYAGDEGTARWYRIDSIPSCGKTGTAQNPHGENHSIFIAFAPVNNPKIAVAVVVENAGYGATWAAPIATMMMEYYLKGRVKPTYYLNKILNANLIEKIERAKESVRKN